MPILYALVARNLSVLAEYTSSSGNFPTVTRVLLSKIPKQDGRMSYEYDKNMFHYIVDQGITFLCMADNNLKRRVAFAFLEEIMQKWRENYGSIESSALAFSLNDLFSPVLKQSMENYSSNQSNDNITKVQNQIESVREVMMDNIDLLLDRGEKIELLVDKTDKLNENASKFEKASKRVRNTMACRRIRNYLILSFVIIVILFIILIVACGINFGRCKPN